MSRNAISAVELIKRFLRNNSHRKFSPQDVADELELNYATVKAALWRLSHGNEVQCNEYGKYQWSGEKL